MQPEASSVCGNECEGALVSSFEREYPSLRRVAGDMMRAERRSHTLQATALAHEAFLKLCMSARQTWTNDGHFISIMVRTMRQILVDHARKRRAARNGGGLVRVALHAADQDRSVSATVKLDDLLTQLERIDSRAARIVELSYYGGFSHEEIATQLGLTAKTIQRDWSFARAWLEDALQKER